LSLSKAVASIVGLNPWGLAVALIGGALLIACSYSNSGMSTSRSSAVVSQTTPHASVDEVKRYATQIGGILRAIHACAWGEKNDVEFLTDNEAIAMCEGDNQSIDSYLPNAAPYGFANTQSKLHRLKHDLETHNQGPVLPDFQQETADASLIVKSFTADLKATKLPGVAKQRILKAADL
jgi:hypothetical protein